MIGFILSLLALFFYPILEGKREYYFYLINQKAKFPLRSVDSDRKTTNVGLFILFAISLSYENSSDWLQLLSLFLAVTFWRWVALDGILNMLRGLDFWYAGNSGRSFTDKILYPLPRWLKIIVKCLPFVAFLTLYFILKIKA
tara:strand:+ start:19096 stop:19521 length:426 start_codon:yes stop_codon:yes gene_type:complete